MSQEEIQKLVEVRMMLLQSFTKHKDWRNNKNAIMREIDHIETVGEAIKKIDVLLSGHVTFS
tara:strand:- start:2989 stop:3174 length:186 start_codon:yes stop_codon:yes gene_type:complete